MQGNQSKTEKVVHHIDREETKKEQSPVDIVHVHSVSPSTPQSYMVPVEINGTPLMMELDTGATVSLISKQTWSEVLHSPEMQPSSIKLQSYPNKSLPVQGCCTVDIKIQNNNAVKLPLIVVEGQGPSLLGRNWLEQVKLDWSEVAKTHIVTPATQQEGELEKLLDQYKDVISEKLGHCKTVKAKLYLKPDVVPRFYRP